MQTQVNQAIEYTFDGIIVYVDQDGLEPAFYAAGWKNKEKKIPAFNPSYLFPDIQKKMIPSKNVTLL